MTTLETLNTVLLIMLSITNVYWWYRFTRMQARYLKYKKMVMVSMYGMPKSKLMTKLADIKGSPIQDIPPQRS